MNAKTNKPALFPDAVINWTTIAALLAFGVIYSNDAVIMWRTLLALGTLSAANELLKLRAKHLESGAGYLNLRWLIAIVYGCLMLFGFLLPPP